MELFLKADPNALGEILRAATFSEQNLVDDGSWSLGCRDTFVVREDATPWDELRLRAFYDQFLPEETDDLVRERPDYPGGRKAKGYSFELDGLTIDCSWFWDGDGILLYGVFKDGELVSAIENTDCKKNNVWRNHDDPQSWGGVAESFREARALEGRELYAVSAESEDNTRPRSERRFFELEQAEAWAQGQIGAGYDRAEIAHQQDGQSALIKTLRSSAAQTQAAADPLSGPSALSGP
jgi:hypothetical protein